MSLTVTHRRTLAPGDDLLGLVDAMVRRRVPGWAEVSYLSPDAALVVVSVPLDEPHVVAVHARTDLAVSVTADREPWELHELLRALRPADDEPRGSRAFDYKTYLNLARRAA
ncbi:hypothetical protein [Actinoalloteichus sp. GBA129-24]|uniref:hypothetical protein n=1 Tax=Actinoalloteichus sp. GBA129-24 TaxID=1612551 RepID=UPI0009504258|nr:hypothetical protein [Actinoalloteichus sp. GBA129-24]APU20891.1 hypothetical protein UA75_14405 [Actinoalloteichus sp. GBA129-24]APU24140.1 hypothetical protein UA75_30885 [Actinoalloteichus sp. GBA129-24]